METHALPRRRRRIVILTTAAAALAASILVSAAPGRASMCSDPAPSSSGSGSPSASSSPSPSIPALPATAPRANGPAGGTEVNADGSCNSAISLSANPSAGGVIGTTFVISGNLACNGTLLVGKPVTLKKLSGGTWVAAGDGQTDEQDATFSFTQKPSVNTTYKIVFGGDSLCNAATSPPLLIVVRPGAAMNAASGTGAEPGGTAVFSGAILPSHAGHGVVLQVLQGGAWRNATSARLDSGSRYRMSYRRSSGSGPLLFRLAYPTQHGDHGWNISRSIRVTWS